MYSHFRSLLFKLDPETAHALTLSALQLAGVIRPVNWALSRYFAAPAKPVEAFGLKFKNPVGLAAGYDKDGVATWGLATLGFGHIEIGTVTPRPQPGNPQPRVFRLVEDQAVINRMGFPSRGSEYVQTRLNPGLARGLQEWLIGIPMRKARLSRKTLGTILGVNLGKNKETPNEQAVFDYLSLLQSFAPLADYLTINISSPNTPGLRNLQSRAALEGLLSQLQSQRKLEETRWEKSLPLLVKLSPDLSAQELDEAVGVILDTGMDGVIATNTTLAREGLHTNYQAESGGLSGKPLTGRSNEILAQVVKKVGGRIPVIGVGGIMNPDDAKRKLDLGATLIQVYTGLIYAGPGLVKNIVKNIQGHERS
ncbi:MAG: quinone-dependent dihydroorotate dehydrogenase [Chloroflexi bacterium]|nr:quinone-dependent dihydroorotate dehydrogenase [Chloroflexota bacterium]